MGLVLLAPLGIGYLIAVNCCRATSVIVCASEFSRISSASGTWRPYVIAELFSHFEQSYFDRR